MNKKEKNPNNIGSLWIKKSQTGKTFLSGLIEHKGEKVYFSVFPNTYKDNEKQPDYNIMKSNYEAPKDEFIGETNKDIGKDVVEKDNINPKTGEQDIDDDIVF